MDYFKDVYIWDINELFNNNLNIYAHKRASLDNDTKIEYETLKEHSSLTLEYFKRLCVEKNLHIVFKNIEEAIVPKRYVDFWKELFVNAIYLHDIGKINLGFQSERLNNFIKCKGYEKYETEHSSISSVVYLSICLDMLNEIQDKMTDEEYFAMLFFIFLNSYIIGKHHGSLGDDVYGGCRLVNNIKKWVINCSKNISLLGEQVYRQCMKIVNMDEEYLDYTFSNVSKYMNHTKNIVFYIYGKVLFSSIVSADFYATYEFMNNSRINSFGALSDVDKNNYIETFEKNNIVRSVREYSKNRVSEYKNINQLRSEMFLESEEKMKQNKDKNIFFLEAPTGAGKTYTSINLSLNLLKDNDEINKLFYVFPFNTLVEQTHETLEKMLLSNVVVNSISPVSKKAFVSDNDNFEDNCNDEKSDEEAYLNRQFLHYGVILLSHIGLFNTLFGVNKNSNFPLLQMCNSVIVLDEIQSYKNNIWKQMMEMLDVYSSILNIKFIIMSATLPRLDNLLDIKSSQYVNLIDNRGKYFSNPIFKNRVKINYELLKCNRDLLFSEIKSISINLLEENKKVVIEFIKKNSAIEFLNYLNEGLDEKLYSRIKLITGDDSSLEKKKIINYVKDNKDGMILVATQVIEAGVDIDMDVGFKDVSLIDNEEQFMGRVNRNASHDREGIVYFFNYDSCEGIYRDDCRKNYSIISEKYKDILISKDFELYYKDVLDFLKKSANMKNNNSYVRFYNDLKEFKFFKLKENLTLIDNKKSIRIFLNREVEDLSGNKIQGYDIWNNYKEILKDKNLSYAEKKNKLFEIQEKLDYFTYEVIVSKLINENSISYNDKIGDILYIEDGYKYLTENNCNGKFDRTKLIKGDLYDIW